jgi:hypothetical protein
LVEKKQFEFFLLRYVPDAVKGEFVNFGVVTVGNGANGAELIDVRFTKDRSRILCLDPQADLEVLTKVQEEIRNEIGRVSNEAAFLRRIEDSFSGVIQIERLSPAWSEKTAADEIEIVARAYLEISKQRRVREPAGRQRILEKMRDEFDKTGVLRFMSAVPAEPYTKAGDPFEFDFGYRVAEKLKLFHAVSMRASVDSGVMLAARYPKILPVMAQVTQATPMLTAVVEDDLDNNRNEVQFATEMMKENGIQVAEMKEIPDIAATARVDLRV